MKIDSGDAGMILAVALLFGTYHVPYMCSLFCKVYSYFKNKNMTQCS